MFQALITVTPMLVCGFWSIMLLLDLRRHGDRGAHSELLLWAFTATLLYMGHCAFFNRTVSALPFFDTIYVTCNLAVFPLYLRYLTRLTEGRVSRAMLWAVGVPPAAMGIVTGALYVAMDAEQTRLFVEGFLYHHSFSGLTGAALAQGVVHDAGKGIFAVGVVLTLWMGLRKVRRYNRLIDATYADTDAKRLRNIGTVLLLVLMALTSFMANAIGKHFFSTSIGLLTVPFLLFSVLLFALCYEGYYQRFSYTDVELAGAETDVRTEGGTEAQVKASPPSREAVSTLCCSIQRVMAKDHLFLVHDLKVGDLAHRLGTNSRYVQEALNREMNTTFSDYVNEWRVNYAERLLEAEPDISIGDLVSRSGFSSSSTFYRNFKQRKGYKPNVARSKK